MSFLTNIFHFIFIFEDSYLQSTQVHLLFPLIYKFTFINLRTEFYASRGSKGNRRPLVTGYIVVFHQLSYGHCESFFFLLKIYLKGI